ncbi:MAG: bifunctional aconitate hydratase 2/2-methylisocitrate dehydratase [bacterium]|nr:bifunctional aconitate hydratase 2/2-methylisocitrate dehydratase [bacterium]
MIEAYLAHQKEREEQGVPALPLDPKQTEELCGLLVNPPAGKEEFLLDLISNRVSPGVDPAAMVKAGFLTELALGEKSSPLIDKKKAVFLLGTMVGGYNIKPLVDLLKDAELGAEAAEQLKNSILVADAFAEVKAMADGGNAHAKGVLQSWADAEWYTNKPEVPATVSGVVYKVDGETNTDDLSPASEAWSRPDIPMHAKSMGQSRFPGGIAMIEGWRAEGKNVIYVGDVVGTGSSRKSAANSVIWYTGEDIAFVPNKRRGGVVIGSAIAPIFYNTAEDSGALPIRCDVSELTTGKEIVVDIKANQIKDAQGNKLADGDITPSLLEEVRAGGRVNLIIGKELTERARKALGLGASPVFLPDEAAPEHKGGYSLAQKMVGKACELPGVLPGQKLLPKMTTVGSQDTTGPMTRDEMMELACLGFQADLVLQSFCHTAAYPKPADIKTHRTLPKFITDRKGVSLRPGDGVIHSWLNRMLLPDTVGTGGDSHTRFPIGISFPAGSGLVAFAAATGKMPLDMPESVLVRFKGKLQPGITLRDVVNAIPYQAIKQGLLTVEKKGKKNIFNGRILEIEGLPDLTIEQAFELTDASAERSAAACAIALGEKTVVEFTRSNAALLKSMLRDGYGHAETIQNRINEMEKWLAKPELLKADANAEYAAVVEIDLDAITEPILACPNDPDDVKSLSEIGGSKVDEVFIGSCMTNIGHFRAAAEMLRGEGQSAARLWVCPPTRMDQDKLIEEGYYSLFGTAGARMEVPGCSLCMGNQARVADGATVVSTSTRNFDNRLGKGAQVYLSSAELAAMCALLGRLPTKEEYLQLYQKNLAGKEKDIYVYLDFSKLDEYAA